MTKRTLDFLDINIENTAIENEILNWHCEPIIPYIRDHFNISYDIKGKYGNLIFDKPEDYFEYKMNQLYTI